MKSNYVKYCLVALWITALFTSFQSSAFFVQSLSWCSDWSFPNCNLNTNGLQYRNNTISSDYNDFNSLNYYYRNSSSNWWNYYTLNSGDYISNGFLKSYNDWDWVKFGWYNYNSSYSFVAKTTYNFIKLWKEGSIPTFSMWSDLEKKYITRSTTQLPNIWNGAYTDSFEYFAPRHDSFVFYNAWYKSWFQTIQFIWSQVLDKYFVYVDTLDNSENVWLIDLYNMKAWSMYVDDVDYLSHFLFWSINFGPDYIDDYWRENSYDVILNDWWNSFYPLTAWNRVCSSPSYASNWNSSNMWFTSCSRYNVGLTYVNTIFEKPNFWWGDNDSSWSGDDMRSYQQCIDEISVIKRVASLEYACYNTIDYDCNCQYWNCSCLSESDYNWLYNFIKDYVWTWNYTWNLRWTSCDKWYNYTLPLYFNEWSWSYSSKILTANEWSVSPNDIYPSDYCEMYLTNNESSFLCKLFGMCDSVSLGGMYDRIKGQLLPFLSEPFDEVISKYQSWYNYAWWWQCIYPYNRNFSWWNYLVIFFMAIIIIYLYWIFKE